MTPKEKAVDLFNKFNIDFKPYSEYGQWDKDIAKKNALIAVELRLEGDFIFSSIEYGEASLEYWEQVKAEIKEL